MRKRVFYLWTLTSSGQIAQDPHDRPTPYLWGSRKEAAFNADCLPMRAPDKIQRVKVTVEPAGPAREVKW